MKKSLPVELLASVARRLEKLASILSMTDREIADRLGVSPQAWNNYSKGARPLPVDVALELKRLSDTTLDWIYTGDERGLSVTVRETLGGRRPPVRLVKAAETQPERSRAGRTRNR